MSHQAPPLFPYQDGRVPVAGASAEVLTCAFPDPTPRAQYCHPAPYTQVNGQRYHNLVTAYGMSRRVHH